MIVNRRKLITGLVSFIAAPAIVRAANLMPINPNLLSEMGPWSVPLFWAEVDTVRFKVSAQKPDNVTVNGRMIYHPDGRPLIGGDLVAGKTYTIKWDELGRPWLVPIHF